MASACASFVAESARTSGTARPPGTGDRHCALRGCSRADQCGIALADVGSPRAPAQRSDIAIVVIAEETLLECESPLAARLTSGRDQCRLRKTRRQFCRYALDLRFAEHVFMTTLNFDDREFSHYCTAPAELLV